MRAVDSARHPLFKGRILPCSSAFTISASHIITFSNQLYEDTLAHYLETYIHPISTSVKDESPSP